MKSNPRRDAENALWHALEERRDAIRAKKLVFSERQHHQFREAHAAGTLIATLCKAMENYRSNSPGEAYYLEAQARQIKAGLENWEHVLIRQNAPWSPYVTSAARRGANQCIKDAKQLVPFV